VNNEFSPDFVSTHNSTKQSKQMKYYYRNREQINAKRRSKSKTAITSQKNKKIEKSNDIFYHKYSSLTSVSKDDNNQKKTFLSFFDMLNYAQSHLIPERKDIIIIPMKTPYTFVLPEIVQYTTFLEQASFSDLEHYCNLELHCREKFSKHQLRHAMQLLVNLKWLIRRGKNDFAVYYPNPFIATLWKGNPQNAVLLAEFARLKVDFFQLLNVPLINALRSNQKIVKTEVTFHKYSMEEAKPWVRAWFEGFVNIKLYAENADEFQTYLPVNFHASNKIEWVKGRRKQNPYGFPHHTLPLSWKLFDIMEGRQYTKKGRESRWSKDVRDYEYIHFDNSFKILHYNLKTEYGRAQSLMFKKPFEYALKKWNTKNCEYVEVSSFELLEKLFHYRFVENKRCEQLFDCLGLEHKPVTGRPKKI
jgi:hypothetical protein